MPQREGAQGNRDAGKAWIASIEGMGELLNQTAQIVVRYLETLDARGVAPTSEALARILDVAKRRDNDCYNPQQPYQVHIGHKSGLATTHPSASGS